LESLRPYFTAAEFEKFMAMVKAVGVPTEFELSQNYPNPFNPETSIEYALPENAKIRLSVFNMLGQEVQVLVDGQMEAGYHKATFDGADMSSGVYFYRLQVDNNVMTKKMVLMK
jgi:hypothetical protein